MFKTKYRVVRNVFQIDRYDVQERYWWWPVWSLTNFSIGWRQPLEEAKKYKDWLAGKNNAEKA